MKANTKFFGEVEIEDEKIITMAKGMIGFPELQHFALISDKEKEDPLIMWLQSISHSRLCIPIGQWKIISHRLTWK